MCKFKLILFGVILSCSLYSQERYTYDKIDLGEIFIYKHFIYNDNLYILLPEDNIEKNKRVTNYRFYIYGFDGSLKIGSDIVGSDITQNGRITTMFSPHNSYFKDNSKNKFGDGEIIFLNNTTILYLTKQFKSDIEHRIIGYPYFIIMKFKNGYWSIIEQFAIEYSTMLPLRIEQYYFDGETKKIMFYDKNYRIDLYFNEKNYTFEVK